MKTPINLPSRPWILVTLAIILLSAHGFVFYLIRHHLPLSAKMLSGVAAIVLVRHLGAFSSLYALFRKRAQKAGGRSS